jgi:hypothetical protein
MGEKFFKDETIKRWISKKGKKEFEKEIDMRLDFIEKDYKKKKLKLLYIKDRLKQIR